MRHVADCDATGDKEKMSVVIQTTVISIALFTLALILGAYPAAKMYFSFTLKAGVYHAAIEILPITLLAFFVVMVAGIYVTLYLKSTVRCKNMHLS